MYLHIGGHKTGTTYLQSLLWHNHAKLREAGVLYPNWAPDAHALANLDLRNVGFRGYRSPRAAGAWRRLVDEVRAWGETSVISHELFSLLKGPQISAALRDLQFGEVHVVFTARDMARQLPAAWQEWVKNRVTLSYRDFIAAIQNPDSYAARRLMSMQDVPAILDRWAALLPAENIHLVTVPPPGADRLLLWSRFATVLGVEPDQYEQVEQANTSLGAAEVAVLQHLNVQAAGGLAWPEYVRMIKDGLAPALARRGGTRIELPEEGFEWAVAWAERAVKELGERNYPVIGDLDDLIPRWRPTGLDPDDPPPADLAEAATVAVRILVRRTSPEERPEAALAAATAIIARRAARRPPAPGSTPPAPSSLPPGPPHTVTGSGAKGAPVPAAAKLSDRLRHGKLVLGRLRRVRGHVPESHADYSAAPRRRASPAS